MTGTSFPVSVLFSALDSCRIPKKIQSRLENLALKVHEPWEGILQVDFAPEHAKDGADFVDELLDLDIYALICVDLSMRIDAPAST
jgi:hypothetical protein